jgi:peroxiredoxin (alkyl hydroperoxide reductase subunit C)
MSIYIGQPAPEFVADAYVRDESEPSTVSLSDLRGRWVVLFFYPRDFTFVCPTEIQEFSRLHPQFKRERAVVVAASTDSYFSHKAWYETDARLQDVMYPVLADTSHRISAQYGVLMDDGTALRGTYIIDPDGIVRHLQINDLDVGRNVEETLRLLRALRTGELCPASWHPGEPTLSDRAESAA